MSHVLNDFSVPALVAANKANLFDWYRYLGSSPNAELYESPEQAWLLTGIPMGFLNVVLRTQVEPGRADAIIERTLAHVRSKNVTRLYTSSSCLHKSMA